MNEEINILAIKDWLNGKGKWSLGESELDKSRLKFRQNLLILLDRYVKHQQTPEEKSFNFSEEIILRKNKNNLFGETNFTIIGYLTYFEQTDFRDKYLLKFSDNPLKVEFFINKNQATQLLKDFNVPTNIEKKPKLKKPIKDDIENATKIIKDKSKVDWRIKVQDELYNARKIYLIGYAIANNIEGTYISTYYLTEDYKKPLIGMNYKFYNRKDEEVDMSKNTNKATEVKNKIELLKYQKQIILQGPPGTGKTRLAKIIARSIINGEEKANIDDIKEQVTLIQFHPSYSYEDFVRGIVAKTEKGKGGGIKYVVENKVLAEMAQKAKGSLDDKYFDKETTEEEKEEILEKSDKFIVIIDEINRANLSSVLGELIYALEYRDEAVESMYSLKEDKDGKSIDLEKQREIILPKNLYIIGTMNTADRSVGHIDYAIRRRFSFESVLPDESVVNDKELFEKVEALFYEDKKAKTKAKTLSIEFFPDDVQLGHSYFIGKSDELNKKLQYQVKPLLHEYIKDGVLEENSKIANEKISDYIDSLRVTLSNESS